MPVKIQFGFIAFFLGLCLWAMPAAAETLPEVVFYEKSERPVTLADFKGQVVLVNLWATWCPPCVAEMPALDRLQTNLGGKGLRVVAISLDTTNLTHIADFLSARGVTQLPVYWDKDRQIVSKWPYRGIPTSYLLDRDGRVVKRYDGGYEWDTDPKLLEEIGVLLP